MRGRHVPGHRNGGSTGESPRSGRVRRGHRRPLLRRTDERGGTNMQTRPIRLLAPLIAGALLAACGGDEQTTIAIAPEPTVITAAGDGVADSVAEFRSMVGNP